MENQNEFSAEEIEPSETDDEFNQIFAQSSYYRPEVTKILRKKNITQDPDLPDPDVGC